MPLSQIDIERYFSNCPVDIIKNSRLREPQLKGYIAALRYFRENPNGHALLILPVGSGKSGLIAMLPFRIAKGRVLVITPNTKIRQTIENALDPTSSDNFYFNQKILTRSDCPRVVVLGSEDVNRHDTDEAHIVVTNIQQLQNRTGWLEQFPFGYFDLIMVDEAHHNVASSWQEVFRRFYNAKIISLTGTPFRSDDMPVEGEEIYRYSLSRAMDKGYIKRVIREEAQPQRIWFTHEGSDEELTLEQVLEMKEQAWFSRGVALSIPCCETIVDRSIEKLRQKRDTGFHHKIIAAAMSINHANQIKALYEARGLRTFIIHSRMPEDEQDNTMIEFERYGDCIVQVGMLGEGYDHPPLSIAAIFRPFRTLSAYIQFVGRTLRSIKDAPNPALDNIAEIVTHVGLNQQENWQDFTRFDELDRSKFVDIGDSSEGTEEGGSERVRRLREEMVVHEEEGVSFDTDGYQPGFIDAYREAIRQFLQKEMKPRAEELGIDLEGIEYLLEEFGELPDFSEDEVQRIPIRPDRARNQLKRILNARVKAAGARILADLGFEFQGRDLIDIVGDGDERNNVQVVMRLLNRAVNKAIGLESGQRRECNKEQYEEALNALPNIENDVFELLRNRLM
jgi:superfamily II DNA or RNA helicase